MKMNFQKDLSIKISHKDTETQRNESKRGINKYEYNLSFLIISVPLCLCVMNFEIKPHDCP